MIVPALSPHGTFRYLSSFEGNGSLHLTPAHLVTLAETEAPLAVIRDLNAQGVTFIMVEHVMPVIMRAATRLVVINFGEKIAQGPPAEIVRDRRVIDAYFGEELDA